MSGVLMQGYLAKIHFASPAKQDLSKVQALLIEADFWLDSMTIDGKEYWLWVVLHTTHYDILEFPS